MDFEDIHDFINEVAKKVFVPKQYLGLLKRLKKSDYEDIISYEDF